MKIATTVLAALVLAVSSTARADIAGNPEKISGWVVAYETDGAGNTVRGSLNRLVTAVRSGADVKVAFGNPVSALRPCDLVDIFTIAGEEHVGCSVNNTPASILSGLDPLTLRPNPYFAFQWFDTLNRSAIVRSSIFGGASQGSSIVTISSTLVWFAKVR